LKKRLSGNQLTDITIPNAVATIGASAFRDNQLTKITIPRRVTSIGNSAFAGNPIISITVPAGLILSNDPDSPAFPVSFDAFYYANGAKAGTYTLNNGAYWSYSER
jgi:hypothetical protein